MLRKLPDWLLHPRIIEDITDQKQEIFDDFSGINTTLVENLKGMGVQSLFPGKFSIQNCLDVAK